MNVRLRLKASLHRGDGTIMRVERARARARIMGSYSNRNEYLAGCRIKATQSASATQRPPALWRQNPSGRDLYGQGRVWESALPLSRRIVDGPENRDWSSPDCGSAAAAVAGLPRKG